MISAVILTWNSEKYIIHCLKALIKALQFNNEDYEILVVDNGSDDRTPEILAAFGLQFNLRYWLLKENKGTTYSRNLALKEAKGDYILILDSDTEVSEESIKLLKEKLVHHPEIGLIAPKLTLADGSLQYSFKRFPTLGVKILKYLPIKFFRRWAEKNERYNFILKEDNLYLVDYCISACWLLKKEVREKVGLFDENIFYAPEDVDYCVRIHQTGYQIAYYPKAIVKHYTQRLSYQNKKILKEHWRGLRYYFKKYHYGFNRQKLYRQLGITVDKKAKSHYKKGQDEADG